MRRKWSIRAGGRTFLHGSHKLWQTVRDERLERDVAVTALPSGNFHLSYFLVRLVVDQMRSDITHCKRYLRRISRDPEPHHSIISFHAFSGKGTPERELFPVLFLLMGTALEECPAV
jgi:hypothetical protein